MEVSKPSSLKRGSKFEYVPLLRENRQSALDPQYDGRFMDLEYVVFYNYGDGTLGAAFFRTKTKAQEWALREGVREAQREVDEEMQKLETENGGHIGE